MIFDDDDAIQEILQLVLEEENYAVLLPDKSIDAIRQMRQCAPDAVIVDLHSAFSGHGGIQKIRKDRLLQYVPVLALSVDQHREKEAFDSGADRFICKPFSLDDLYRHLAFMVHSGVRRYS